MATNSRLAAHSDRRTSATQSRKIAIGGNIDRRREINNITTRETEIIRTRSPVKLGAEQQHVAKKSRETLDKGKEPGDEGSWSPHATIIHHTTAPLANRISIPPLASSAPIKLNPQPLSQLSTLEQEKAILEDLLFVFMGFEGQYIRYVDTYDPLEEKDRLVGPHYRVLSGLDPSIRDLTTSTLKMATHYIAVETFIEVQSREEYGTVSHALCATIRKLLQEYLVLIAQLEHQMLTYASEFTLHTLNILIKPTMHILAQIYHLAVDLLKANSILDDDANGDEDDGDESDDVENILESLREGNQGLQTKKCKGGNVIGLITRRLGAMAGDPAAKQLLTTLLRESSRPYMKMLNEWLHHGGIKDPHGEFLIREQRSIKRERLDEDYTDEYWEKRYTIRDNMIPPQLESVKEKVLLAGKYLNVVRECGGVDVSKEVRHVPFTFDDARFLENVNNAYAYANSSLLTLLLTTHALPERLRSLKHYFFLDRSDFFTYFLELGASELRKSSREVNSGKLQSLLDIAIRQPGSVAADDPYKEDIKVSMNEIKLIDWLMKIVNVTGLDQDALGGSLPTYTPATSTDTNNNHKLNGYEALVFDYAVPFPLSLVVSRVTLTRYQLIFRHLLALRHLENLLVIAWTDHNHGSVWKHRSSNSRIERAKRKAWSLRARMLVFVQQLLYYSTVEVIERNWQALIGRIKSDSEIIENSQPNTKRTVDELMQDHVDFLASCLKECMLTNAKLLKLVGKILDTCSHYAEFTHTLARYIETSDSDLANKSISTTLKRNSQFMISGYDPAKLDKLEDGLFKYEISFSRSLKVLLDHLNYLGPTETSVFLNLCARLEKINEGQPTAYVKSTK